MGQDISSWVVKACELTEQGEATVLGGPDWGADLRCECGGSAVDLRCEGGGDRKAWTRVASLPLVTVEGAPIVSVLAVDSIL